MTLARDSWWGKAKDLDLGRSQRVAHDCGQGTTMIVSRDAKGFHAYCFRCNDKDWVAPLPEPLAVRLTRLAAGAQADTAILSSALPTPTVPWSEWPAAARLWLLKAGLGGHDAGRLGAYYHPPSSRVVLPVLDPRTGASQFWQARSVDGRVPKYLNPGVGKARAVPQYGKAKAITLTEDILSAYKVGKVAEGWCLLGTRISNHCLTLLIERDCPVNVWLDPDGAGIKGAKHTEAALRASGIKYRRIESTSDPKLMHLADIRALLEN
jgi:hypothetical protein